MNPSDSTTVIDPELLHVEQLEPFIEIGLTDFLDILGDVISDVPLQIERIHHAIRDGDVKELKARAHSMRGMVANFGCVGMTKALHEIECGENLASDQAEAVRQHLSDVWEKSLAAIKEWENSIPDFR